MLAIKINDMWTQWTGQPLTKIGDDSGETFTLSQQIDGVWDAEALAIWGLKQVTPCVIPATPDVNGRTVISLGIEEAEDGTLSQVPTYRDPDANDIAAKRQQIMYYIPAKLNQAAMPILAYYPEAEKSGWVAKEAEARAYKALGDSPDLTVAPLLTGLAEAQNPGPSDDAARKAQVSALADIVIAKADAFRAVSVASEAIRTQFQTALAGAITFADLNGVQAQFDSAVEQLVTQI